MAKEVDELIVQIKADTRDLRRELKNTKQSVNSAFPTGGRSPIVAMGGQLKGLIAPLAAVGAGIATIGALKGIASVGAEFEDLQDSLNQVFGSIEAGDKAMEQILNFAQTTPFQIETVTKAFIALKGAGLEPNIATLQTFADTASTTTDQLGVFEALVRVTQRSVSGGVGLEELNQIADRGIDVFGMLSRRLDLSRDEIATFGKTAEGAAIIMRTLTEAMNDQFGGAMEAKMDNLSTKLSNMEIAFKDLGDALFQTGLGQFFKDMADDITAATAATAELIRVETARAGGQRGLPQSVRLALRQEESGVDMLGVGSVDDAINAAFENVRRQREGAGSFFGFGYEAEMEAARETEDALYALIDARKANVAAQERASGRSAALAGMGVLAPTMMEEGFTELERRRASQAAALVEAQAIVKKALEDSVTAAEELQEQFDALALAKDHIPVEEYERVLGYLQGIKREQQETIDAANAAEQERQARALAEAERERLSVYEDLRSVAEAAIDPVREVKEQIERFQEVLASQDQSLIQHVFGDLSKEEISEMFNSMKEGLQDMTDPAEEAAETIGDILGPAVQSMSLQFTNEFVNSLLEGENALSSFKDFSKNIVSQIISTFLQLMVVNKILNSIFGAGTFSTGSFGPKGFSVTPAGASASGGAMSRGKSYLVGERGPELFIPQVAGTLKNGNDTRSMMGGGTPIVVNQSLNFSTGVVPTVRAEVQRMLPQISEVTKTSVLEATRRGGNYRKGLLGA